MNLRRNLATAIVACGLIAGTAALAAPPVEWDGMQRVSSKRFDHAYLAPASTSGAIRKSSSSRPKSPSARTGVATRIVRRRRWQEGCLKGTSRKR